MPGARERPPRRNVRGPPQTHALARLREPRPRGQSHALNQGYARATAGLCGWINRDAYSLPGAVRFPAYCQHKSLGVCCRDLWDPLHRDSARALWQFHLLFVRRDRPEFL